MKATGLLVFVGVMFLVNSAQGGVNWRSGSGYKSNPSSSGSKASYTVDAAGQRLERSKLSNSTESKFPGKTSRAMGISAWGIIGVIVGVISLTTVAYYTFILYPYVCKKQRRYDMMELSDVI